jgi:hypothetical protein
MIAPMRWRIVLASGPSGGDCLYIVLTGLSAGDLCICGYAAGFFLFLYALARSPVDVVILLLMLYV